jgi:hypothetical protein
MTMIYSEGDAALIEAHRRSLVLVRRYRHAAEALLAEGERRDRVETRADALAGQAEQLERLIRQRDLMPRDADSDLTDLKELGDSVRSWLDEEAAASLFEAFAEEEGLLAEELERAREEGVSGLAEAIDAAREAADGGR